MVHLGVHVRCIRYNLCLYLLHTCARLQEGSQRGSSKRRRKQQQPVKKEQPVKNTNTTPAKPDLKPETGWCCALLFHPVVRIKHTEVLAGLTAASVYSRAGAGDARPHALLMCCATATVVCFVFVQPKKKSLSLARQNPPQLAGQNPLTRQVNQLASRAGKRRGAQ